MLASQPGTCADRTDQGARLGKRDGAAYGCIRLHMLASDAVLPGMTLTQDRWRGVVFGPSTGTGGDEGEDEDEGKGALARVTRVSATPLSLSKYMCLAERVW